MNWDKTSIRFINRISVCSLIVLICVRQDPAQEISKAGDKDQTTIRFNIADKNRNFIRILRKEDIRVFEDGTLQSVLDLQQQSDIPLTIGLLVDVSLSQERTLPVQKTVALSFLYSVMHSPRDTMAVISFTGKVNLDQDLTGDWTPIQKAIERLRTVELPPDYLSQIVKGRPKPGSDLSIGSTAMWDAIFFSCEEVLARSSSENRRSIVLLTDGEDTNSQKQMKEAVEQAVKSNVAVYAIGIGDEERAGVNRRALRAISEETGGRAFFPKSAAEMRAAFVEIERELRENYLITYVPQTKKSDNPYRKIRLEIENPDLRRQSLRISYCNRYFKQRKD